MKPRLSQIRPEGTAGQYPKVNPAGTGWTYDSGGGVTLDTTAGDIGAETFGATAAAGSTGKAADAGHRHPMPADPTGKPLALTGATTATRYVGGTASGHPTTGTFAVGDFVVTADGHVWICTTAGSPGTWADAGAGGGLSDPTTTLGDLLVHGPSGITRLPAGTDGQVLTARSTATNGIDYEAPSSTGSVFAFHRGSTSGFVTATSPTAWDTTTDCTITAASGSTIEIGLSAWWDNQAFGGGLDVATIVGGSPVTFASSGTSTANGVAAWHGKPSQANNAGGSVFLTLAAGDISSGTVTVRLFAWLFSAGSRTLHFAAADGGQLWVRKV